MNKRILSLAMLAASLPAIAQQDTTKNLDPVTVTANKIEQKQSTTGKVVTVISKEQLEKSSGKTVAQVLNEQAGLVINGAYNNLGSVQTVYMRGASPGRVLILMDGVPVNDPSFINNEYDLNFFSINEVERIEVCRGAQSTLYGSDAVAGVINIITIDKDVKKPFNVKATAAYGSFNTFKGNVQLYGKKERFTYNVRYAKLSTDGFSSAYDSTGTKNFDKDAYKGNVVSASIQYQLSKQTSFRAFSQYSGYKSDIDASIFTDEKDYYIDNSAHTSGVSFTYKAEKVTLTANYQYADLKRTYLNDSGFVAGFSKFERNAYKGRTQFFELFASLNLGSGFTLLQGGDYRYGLMNNDYLSISSFGPYATKFSDTSVSQTSIYASLMYGSKEKKFNAEVGGRLNVHSRYGSNHTYTFNPTYKITEHYRVFGSIATGFKAPSIYQVYDQSVGNRNLKPEQSTNYELGFSEQHKKVRSRLVYFYREIKDGVDFNYITFKYFNFVKQIVRGLEYEITYQPVSKLTITANYTYISSQENTQSRVNFKDTSYTYLLRRPKHNINLNVGCQITDKLFASVNGKYVSSRQDVGGYQKPDVYLKSYYLLSAYAEYKLKHFKFFADAQNVTNNKFFDIRGYNAMPFMFTGGVTFTW
jgi:vitamin B12 transporter